MSAVLILLSIQGFIGAFDNIWHHELTQKLKSKPNARFELMLHTVREFFYAFLFIGLAWFEWKGGFVWVIAAILFLETIVTLWDFIEEDKTRPLPKLERVLHTLLAINFGIVLAFFVPILWAWQASSTAVLFSNYGFLSWLVSLLGMGVFAWALYDLHAVVYLSVPLWKREPIRSGHKLNPSHILITGATGFIGQALVRLLVERGDKVTVYARDVEKAKYLFGPHVTCVNSLDHMKPTTCFDAIINLAGKPLISGWWSASRKKEIKNSRVKITDELIELLKRNTHKPKVFISGSAVGYYGVCADQSLTEDAVPQDRFISTLCQEWEKAAFAAEELGVRTCCLRFGLVLAHKGGAFSQLIRSAKMGIALVLGTGRQWMSWIHLDDALRLILFVLEDEEVCGPINAVAPEPITNSDFNKAVSNYLGVSKIITVPAWLIRLFLGEMADLFVEGQRAVPRKALHLGFTFNWPNLETALSTLLPPKRKPMEQEETCSIYYNDNCPICNWEINHYKSLQGESKSLNFFPAAEGDVLQADYGLTDDDLHRRLYAYNHEGALFGGVSALAILWEGIPTYQWLGAMLRHPIIFAAAEVVYEGFIAPLLFSWHKHRTTLKGKEMKHEHSSL